MSNRRRTKGQSIVEVMVAMTILTIVLGSTFALIINALNLVVEAKDRTEAIEVAQKGISEGILVIQNRCGINTAAPLSSIQSSVAGKTLSVTIGSHPSFDANEFQVVRSSVSWNDKKGVTRSVSVDQLVRTR